MIMLLRPPGFSHRVKKLAVHDRQRPRVEGGDEGGLGIVGHLADALQISQRDPVQSLLPKEREEWASKKSQANAYQSINQPINQSINQSINQIKH